MITGKRLMAAASLLAMVLQASAAVTVQITVVTYNSVGGCNGVKVLRSNTPGNCDGIVQVGTTGINGGTVSENVSVGAPVTREYKLVIDAGGGCSAASTACHVLNLQPSDDGTTKQITLQITYNGGLNQVRYCFHYTIFNPGPYVKTFAVINQATGQTVATGSVGPGQTLNDKYCPPDGNKVAMGITTRNSDGSTAASTGFGSNDPAWEPEGEESPSDPANQSWPGLPTNQEQPTNLLAFLDTTDLFKEDTGRRIGATLHNDIVQGFQQQQFQGMTMISKLDAINTGVGSVGSTLGSVNSSVGALNTTAGQIKTSVDSVKTSVDAAKGSIDAGNTTLGAINTAASSIKLDTAAISVNTSNTAANLGNNAAGFNGVSNAVISAKNQIHDDLFTIDGVLDGSLTALGNINNNITGVQGAVNNLNSGINGTTAAVNGLGGKLDAIDVKIGALNSDVRFITNELGVIIAKNSDGLVLWTNVLGSIGTNNSIAGAGFSNVVSSLSNLASQLPELSISNNISISNVVSVSNLVEVLNTNINEVSITNMIAFTNRLATNDLSASMFTNYDGANAAASSYYAINSEITEFASTVSGITVGESPGFSGMEVTVGGFTLDLNPLNHPLLASVFSFAFQLAGWVLGLMYLSKIAIDTWNIVVVLGMSRGSNVQVVGSPFEAIGNSIGVGLVYAIIIGGLIAWGVLVAAVVYVMADSTLGAALTFITSGPFSGATGAAISNGVALIYAAFPVSFALGLFVGYLVWRLTMTGASMILLTVCRFLVGF